QVALSAAEDRGTFPGECGKFGSADAHRRSGAREGEDERLKLRVDFAGLRNVDADRRFSRFGDFDGGDEAHAVVVVDDEGNDAVPGDAAGGGLGGEGAGGEVAGVEDAGFICAGNG